MSEFSIALAREFHTASTRIEIKDEASSRAAIYTSLLSIEITLKALLERAGVDIKTIIGMSHKLPLLLAAVTRCNIAWEGGAKSASEIRAVVVDTNFADATVGRIIDEPDVSTYPGQIRYGSFLKHFKPHIVQDCANSLIQWADKNYNTIHK